MLVGMTERGLSIIKLSMNKGIGLARFEWQSTCVLFQAAVAAALNQSSEFSTTTERNRDSVRRDDESHLASW